MSGPGDATRERFARLAEAADGAACAALLLGYAKEGPLALAGDARDHAVLRGVALPKARLRRANLVYADLREADLSRAFLPQAVLRHVGLDGARLGGADLSHADCTGAGMGETDLTGALLEEANLSDTSLRFATLTDAALEGATIRGADLWGAKLGGADFAGADLSGAVVREAQAAGAHFDRADLRAASLMDSDFSGATFKGADLRDAQLRGARLAGADFAHARLQGVDLSTCVLTGACWHLAQLDRTQFSREQIGEAVGEERAGDHAGAAGAYMALERNFLDLGDVDAASWAYRRKRRMQKRAQGARAAAAFRSGRWWAGAGEAANWIGSWVVEWTCDYGESIARVFGSLFFTFFSFLILYDVTTSVARLEGEAHVPTHRLIDLALFSLGTMTSNAGVSGELFPNHSYSTFLAGAQATLSIFLMGLLGFVAGNRIRR